MSIDRYVVLFLRGLFWIIGLDYTVVLPYERKQQKADQKTRKQFKKWGYYEWKILDIDDFHGHAKKVDNYSSKSHVTKTQ